MMKSIKILFAICLLLSFCFLLYQVGNRHSNEVQVFSTTSKQNKHTSTEKLGSKVQPSPARYYCNFLTDVDEDDKEGVPPTSNSILKQVQVIIRHGDRSPMSNSLYKRLGIRPEYCHLDKDRPNSHPLLSKFVKDVYNDYANMKNKERKFLVSPYPNKRPCDLAYLSQFGVEQQLRNGLYLRDKYLKEHSFLSENLEKFNLSSIMSVVSTIRARTVHSGIAFLYGLIPDYHLERVPIVLSRSDLFRSSSRCSRAEAMEKDLRKLRYKIYAERQKVNVTFRKLADAFNVDDHSGVLLDSFANGFLCKKYDLPCRRNQCLLLEDLDSILDEEEYLMQKLTQEANFAKQSMLKIHPLLTKILNNMILMVEGSAAVKLAVYSGHDSTLKPLIAALGISDYRWPRLASRLIFELWHDPTDEQHYVRLIFNGKDVTYNTSFCDYQSLEIGGSSVCTVDQFKNYITVEMLRHFGAKTLMQACTGLDFNIVDN